MNSLAKRTIFGALYLAVMLGGLLVNGWAFTILFTFICYVMLREFYKMTCTPQAWKYLGSWMCVCGAAVVFLTTRCFASACTPATMLCIALAVLFLTIGTVSVLVSERVPVNDTLPVYAGLVYIVLPLSLAGAPVFRSGEFSGALMLSFFIIIWASDVGAYCFGMLFGQKGGKKLCPSISPKKSWAGAWGGLFTAIAAGVVMSVTGMLSFPLVHVIGMSIIMNVFSVFGDLFESLWKRAAGVKDSGNLIPGHGGLMDRLDSALFAIPAGYIYLVLFSLV